MKRLREELSTAGATNIKRFQLFIILAFSLIHSVSISAHTLSIFSNPFQYSAEYTDQESHLQYLIVRYYEAATRCFVNRDSFDVRDQVWLDKVSVPAHSTNRQEGPKENSSTTLSSSGITMLQEREDRNQQKPIAKPRQEMMNRYAYTEGNPIMNRDPSGHESASAITTYVLSGIHIGIPILALIMSMVKRPRPYYLCIDAEDVDEEMANRARLFRIHFVKFGLPTIVFGVIDILLQKHLDDLKQEEREQVEYIPLTIALVLTAFDITTASLIITSSVTTEEEVPMEDL